jgi:hypothetical protein
MWILNAERQVDNLPKQFYITSSDAELWYFERDQIIWYFEPKRLKISRSIMPWRPNHFTGPIWIPVEFK